MKQIIAAIILVGFGITLLVVGSEMHLSPVVGEFHSNMGMALACLGGGLIISSIGGITFVGTDKYPLIKYVMITLCWSLVWAGSPALFSFTTISWLRWLAVASIVVGVAGRIAYWFFEQYRTPIVA
ncbi:MAG: hypothetical protein ACI83D_000025 [Planctomycetota bacterium]|jgi:hypothetical protein